MLAGPKSTEESGLLTAGRTAGTLAEQLDGGNVTLGGGNLPPHGRRTNEQRLTCSEEVTPFATRAQNTPTFGCVCSPTFPEDRESRALVHQQNVRGRRIQTSTPCRATVSSHIFNARGFASERADDSFPHPFAVPRACCECCLNWFGAASLLFPGAALPLLSGKVALALPVPRTA